MLLGISGYIGSGKDTLGEMIQYQMYRKHFEKMFEKDVIISFETWKKANGVAAQPLQIHKFGHALKQIVCILTSCTLSQLEDQEFKKRELPAIWNRSVKEAGEWLNLKYNPTGFLASATDFEIRREANNRGFKWTRTYREMMQEIGTEVMRNHFVDNIWINALMGKYTYTGPVYEVKMEGSSHRSYTQLYPDWIITDVRFPNEAKAIKEAGGLLIRIDGLPRVSDHPSEISLDNYQEFDVRVNNMMHTYPTAKNVEESLNHFMGVAAYLVNHFKLSEYAGTNIKPEPDSEPGSERTS